MRAARAVRAVCPTTLTEPDADRAGACGGPRRDDERGDRALDEERRRAQREDPAAAAAVLERHLADVDGDDGAAEPARRVLDHQPGLGGHLRDRLARDPAGAVGREHTPVVVTSHSGCLYRRDPAVMRRCDTPARGATCGDLVGAGRRCRRGPAVA